MSTPRIALASLASGIAMYLWASIAHMALPIARLGMSNINTNEAAVLAAMHTSLGNKQGMYRFPSIDFSNPDAMKAYDAKLVDNPSGLLIYTPPGAQSLTPKQLITEFLAEMLEAALAIYLMTLTRVTSLLGRIAVVAAIGFLASLPTNISYWNWYGFPASYTAGYIFTEIVGFVIAGIVGALILRNSRSVGGVS